MKIMAKDPVRRRHLSWSKTFREDTGHMSLVPRPQTVRTLWRKERKRARDK